MSNFLRSLWRALINRFRRTEPEVVAAEQPAAFSEPSPEPAPTRTVKKKASRGYQHRPWVAEELNKITGAGVYLIAPRGRMQLEKLQHLVSAHLCMRYGKGNYSTRMDRAANRLVFSVYATK